MYNIKVNMYGERLVEFSFLHVSDIHLDRPFSGLSEYSFDDNLIKVYKNAIERAFNNIIDFAIMKNVDFVLIAGDTFDSKEQDFSSKLMLKRALDRLNNAEIKVYLICGNHDPLNSYSKTTFNYDENSSVKIIGLNTPNNVKLPLLNKKGEPAAILHALSFTEEKFNENPVKYFERAQDGFNIGLLHCDLNAGENSPYAPCLLSELKALNYDYFALGHIHLPSLTEDNIQYSGTIQGRNTKETGSHGIRYVKVNENKIVKNSFIPSDIIRFEDIKADITNANDAIEALNIIEDIIREKISQNSGSAEIFLVKPYITGCCSCFSEINDNFFETLSDKIKSDFMGKVYISQAECGISPKIEDNILLNDKGISGEIYRTVENETLLLNSFNSVEETIKNLIDNCNFTGEEYKKFKENVINSTKEECKNLCSIIYENSEIKE